MFRIHCQTHADESAGPEAENCVKGVGEVLMIRWRGQKWAAWAQNIHTFICICIVYVCVCDYKTLSSFAQHSHSRTHSFNAIVTRIS